MGIAMLYSITAYTQNTSYQNITIIHESPFIPKAGSYLGVAAVWDNTGLQGLEAQVFPNARVMVGFAYLEKDIINTGDLLFTEEMVYGKLGLRVLPWIMIHGLVGSNRFGNPHWDFGNQTDELQATIDALPYKDETIYGVGGMIQIPWLLFNRFRVTGGFTYIPQRSDTIFDQTLLDATIADPKSFLSKDLLFQFGVRIPLTEWISPDHQRRTEKRRKNRQLRKETRIKKRR